MQDNKDRFEEFKRRYKFDHFNTDELLRESEEDEEVKTDDWLKDLV